jgi:hypothetical protein
MATVRSASPLPPPVPVEGASEDPYRLSGTFQLPPDQDSFGDSNPFSTSEPKPGQPLSPDAERILADVPENVSDSAGADREPDFNSDGTRIDEPRGEIRVFNEQFIADSLEEAFAFASHYFESDHWLLSETQSRMLSGPSKQLLDSLWTHINRMLPLWLARWSESTPGLIDCVFAFSIVLGAKIAQQVKVSRDRRAHVAPSKPAQPHAVPNRRAATQAVGPIQSPPPMDFEV